MKSNNTQKLSADELQELYGIEVYEDGSVYDPLEDKQFPSFTAWKFFADQQEKDDLYGGFDKVSKDHGYSEDY